MSRQHAIKQVERAERREARRARRARREARRSASAPAAMVAAALSDLRNGVEPKASEAAEAYEALHPETKQHVAGAEAKHGRASDNLSFAQDTAKATGKNRRTVERDAERGEKAITVLGLTVMASKTGKGNRTTGERTEAKRLRSRMAAEQAQRRKSEAKVVRAHRVKGRQRRG